MTVTESPSPTLLNSVIRVRQSSVRSVNLEHDLQSSLIINEYLLTGQSRSSLSRILNRLLGTTPTRAWTLTGPYGTGKSYFALFLMNLICTAHPGHRQALEMLQAIDPVLVEQIRTRFDLDAGSGYLAVPMAGSRAALQEILRTGLRQALHSYAQEPKIQKLLVELEAWGAQTENRAIITWLKKAQVALAGLSAPFQGMLFVLDEMGKPLEYAAANPEKADVFLFQELAEMANRSGDFPIVFIGILHQAFERYASLMNSAAQREWAKVQGRFEDIAFQEPPTQQMRLLARALEAINLDKATSLAPLLLEVAEEANRDGWRPAMLSEEQFLELAATSYPFHPSALVALPLVFKRLAQNERSLFAYLASSEPYGFQDFLQKYEPPAFLRLHHLFDYLTINFQARLYASGRARQITETLERIGSTPNLEPLESDLLKTIGLINWLAESGAVQATEGVVISAVRGEERSDEQIRACLRRMKDCSLIVFRRYNNTYNIWQGSDVDIETRLDQAHQQLTGTFSFAEIVQRYLPPRPLVARRHSYETGALRYFEARYVDSSNYQGATLQASGGASGLVLLALPTNQNEIGQFRTWANSPAMQENANVLVGIAGRSLRLGELAQELRALNWVGENTPEMRDDPVARRELRARLAGVEALINAELDEHLKLHRLTEAQGCEWYWQGQAAPVVEHGGLSHLLSKLCDELYPGSPRVWNELINRRSLSSQAAAARRNLLEAMLTHGGEERLGIAGFPPERSMYETMLRKSGLHRLEGGGWVFGDPPADDPLHLRPAWEAMARFIYTPPTSPRSVDELFKLLEAPPYGLSAGILPVVLCAFLLAHPNDTTLYRENTLLPEPGVPDWEVLLRRTDVFAVAGCRVDETLQPLLERLGRGLQVPPYTMPVVRTLIRSLRSLPEHAWRTQRLPAEALAVRRAVELAHSPELLLFREIPAGLGLAPFDQVPPDIDTIDLFFERLNLAIDALSKATTNLQAQARDALLQACGLEPGEASWEAFRKMAGELASQVNGPTLRPLLSRAATPGGPQVALDSVLTLLVNKPPRTWLDSDTDRFFSQVNTIGSQFQKERDSIKPITRLDTSQRKLCQQISQNVLTAISAEFGDDPSIQQAALNALARELVELGEKLLSGEENS